MNLDKRIDKLLDNYFDDMAGDLFTIRGGVVIGTGVKVAEEGKKQVKQLIAEELEQILIDAKGNEEAGYKPNRKWFIDRINDRLGELKELGL